jgi:hypothetical protein
MRRARSIIAIISKKTPKNKLALIKLGIVKKALGIKPNKIP